MTLILLNGFKKSGKSTSGDYLSEQMGIATYAFAGPLKNIVNELLGWNERHAEGDLKELERYYYLPFDWPGKLIDLLQKHLRGDISDILGTDDPIPLSNYCPAVHLFRDVIVGPFQEGRNEVGKVCLYLSPRRVYQLFGTEVMRDIRESIWLDQAEEALKDNGGDLIITDCRFPNEANWGQEKDGVVVEVIGGMSDPDSSSHSSEQRLPAYLVDARIDNTALDMGKLTSQLDELIEVVRGEV